MNSQQTTCVGVVLLIGLVVLSGCGPSKEQQAIDAFNRGVVHAKQGKFDNAITEAIRLDPKFAEAYCNRGGAYDGQGQFDKAIADCTEAIRLNPKYTKAYYNRGLIHRIMGETAKAESDFAKA